VASDRGAGRGNTASARGVIAKTPLGESRWPPVAAVLVFMALNIVVRVWLPSEGAVHVPWLLPTIEGALLVVLVASDPLEARLLGLPAPWVHERDRVQPR
jgi:hypothetical protein